MKKVLLLLFVMLLMVGSVMAQDQIYPQPNDEKLDGLSFFNRFQYYIDHIGPATVVNGATCSRDPYSTPWGPDTSICPQTYNGEENYGCAWEKWRMVDLNGDGQIIGDNEVYGEYLGLMKKNPLDSMITSALQFSELYTCTDIGCECPSAVDAGCGASSGDVDCPDNMMLRTRTCNPAGCSWEATCSNNLECEQGGDPECPTGQVLCSDGQCRDNCNVVPPEGEITASEVNVEVVGDCIKASVTLTSTKDGSQTGILELQPIEGIGLPFSTVNPIQESCDPNHPELVHKDYSLTKDAAQTINLESCGLEDGTYKAYLFTRKKCYNELTATEKNDLETYFFTDPYGSGQGPVKTGLVIGEELGDIPCGGECVPIDDVILFDNSGPNPDCITGWCYDAGSINGLDTCQPQGFDQTDYRYFITDEVNLEDIHGGGVCGTEGLDEVDFDNVKFCGDGYLCMDGTCKATREECSDVGGLAGKSQTDVDTGTKVPGGEICSVPNGGGCDILTNLPGADDSGPNSQCESGWCQDVFGVGGRCAKVGTMGDGTIKRDFEGDPLCSKDGDFDLCGMFEPINFINVDCGGLFVLIGGFLIFLLLAGALGGKK